jgi:hypothetical protein
MAHSRQVSEISPSLAVHRVIEDGAEGLLVKERGSLDVASFSRAGIVALESTRKIKKESIVRSRTEAEEALVYSKSQILEQTEDAMLTQANQTPERLLALFEER